MLNPPTVRKNNKPKRRKGTLSPSMDSQLKRRRRNFKFDRQRQRPVLHATSQMKRAQSSTVLFGGKNQPNLTQRRIDNTENNFYYKYDSTQDDTYEAIGRIANDSNHTYKTIEGEIEQIKFLPKTYRFGSSSALRTAKKNQRKRLSEVKLSDIIGIHWSDGTKPSDLKQEAAIYETMDASVTDVSDVDVNQFRIDSGGLLENKIEPDNDSVTRKKILQRISDQMGLNISLDQLKSTSKYLRKKNVLQDNLRRYRPQFKPKIQRFRRKRTKRRVSTEQQLKSEIINPEAETFDKHPQNRFKRYSMEYHRSASTKTIEQLRDESNPVLKCTRSKHKELTKSLEKLDEIERQNYKKNFFDEKNSIFHHLSSGQSSKLNQLWNDFIYKNGPPIKHLDHVLEFNYDQVKTSKPALKSLRLKTLFAPGLKKLKDLLTKLMNRFELVLQPNKYRKLRCKKGVPIYLKCRSTNFQFPARLILENPRNKIRTYIDYDIPFPDFFSCKSKTMKNDFKFDYLSDKEREAYNTRNNPKLRRRLERRHPTFVNLCLTPIEDLDTHISINFISRRVINPNLEPSDWSALIYNEVSHANLLDKFQFSYKQIENFSIDYSNFYRFIFKQRSREKRRREQVGKARTREEELSSREMGIRNGVVLYERLKRVPFTEPRRQYVEDNKIIASNYGEYKKRRGNLFRKIHEQRVKRSEKNRELVRNGEYGDYRAEEEYRRWSRVQKLNYMGACMDYMLEKCSMRVWVTLMMAVRVVTAIPEMTRVSESEQEFPTSSQI